MMKQKQPRSWHLDSNGNLTFDALPHIIAKAYAALNAFEHPAAAYFVMLVCGTLDFIVFNQLFRSFLYDNGLMRSLSVIAMLIGFDFAPIYLGMKLRQRDQGYRVSSTITFLLIAAFVLAFIVNVGLRLVLRDVILPGEVLEAPSILESLGVQPVETVTREVNPLALPYAVAVALFPLITSFASFGISYATADPLRDELRRLEKQKLLVEQELCCTDSTLKKIEADDTFLSSRSDEDQKNLDLMLALNVEHVLLCCDYVRQKLKERTQDAAQINALSKDNRAELTAEYTTAINARPVKPGRVSGAANPAA